MSVRTGWILAIIVVVVSLLPGVCWGWATLSDLLPMTTDEQAILQKLIDNFGTNKTRSTSEIVPRRGPHPTHQFVMRQAYLLLEKDPAFEESPWELPTLDQVLSWDGIVRQTGAGGGRAGMWERSGPGTGTAAKLAPAKGAIAGPSADAEITADGNWNATYNAAFHYWNPWLRCGQSPQATARCYVDLVKEMTTTDDGNAKARLVSHMGHYMSDTICGKHADMIALDQDTLNQLQALANAWFTEHDVDQTLKLAPWLASKNVTDAVDLIIKASGVAADSPYWNRVNSHIGAHPLLKTNSAWVRYSVSIAEPSLRNSVAGYLAYLHDRPADKAIDRFYNFFDPFYFNGQIVMSFEQVGDWTPRSQPQFALCTPASEHLTWETNPELASYVNDNLDKLTLGEDPAKVYLTLPEKSDLCSPDDSKRAAAYRESVEEYVQNGSTTSHGSTPDAGNDFGGFQDSLNLSIRHVFSILRATITAIRCEPTYAYFPEEKMYRIYCDISNVAKEQLQVKGVRISLDEGGTLKSCPQWAFAVSKSVGNGAMERVIVELPESRIPKDPEFYADIFGRYKTTPDLGFWRGEVSHNPARIIHGMSMPAFDRVKGALDLVICFDTTGSMSSSIDSVRKNAIRVLTKLKKRVKDVRVALISFKDAAVDRGAFTKTGFSSNISRAISRMNSWKADGGGDEPEDQLAAIRMALDLWGKRPPDPRKPTKIVVVITDASAKDPDSSGNTQASIAKYAEEVDPAHIYPIIVGGATLANEQAKSLAKLTGGEVLKAESGDEVASVLARAVEKAVTKYGQPEGASVPPWVMFYGGLVAIAGGILWIRSDCRKRVRA